MLKQLIAVYVSSLPPELAEAELTDERLALSFAWAGPSEPGLPHAGGAHHSVFNIGKRAATP
ncbi:MAG: hypothetical protein DLM66_11745 [Candidatus Dormiibacter spiritus]|nr:MAG: hypothetical protein DLM66_11745 [Candidatus Dormibacteraeota bacterium]